jgi:hypothetical protein
MSATVSLHFAAVSIARPLVAAFVLLAVTATAHAQVISTWNGTSGDWTSPAIWSTNPYYPNNGNPPGTTYAVDMGSAAGTFTLNVPITVQSIGFSSATSTIRTFAGTGALTVLGQTSLNTAIAQFNNIPITTGSLFGAFSLSSSAPITVNGSMTIFDGVSVSGSGPVTVAGPFSLSGVGQFTLDGRSLTLNGPNNTWTGNSISLQNGAVFTVGSGATLTSSKTFGLNGGTFAVNGTYIVDSTFYSTAPIGANFTNAGTIDICNNPMAFQAPNCLTNTGRVRVGAIWGGAITSSDAAAIVTGSGRYEEIYPGLGGLTFNGGRLAPGDGVGSMTVAVPITMGPGSIFEAELGGPTPTMYDRLGLVHGISMNGSITLNGSSLNTLLEYAPSPTDSFTIVSGGPVTGTFAGLPNGAEFFVSQFNNTDYVGTITYTATSITLSNIHAVPEPAAWLLAGGAAVAWAWRRLVRRHTRDELPTTPI